MFRCRQNSVTIKGIESITYCFYLLDSSLKYDHSFGSYSQALSTQRFPVFRTAKGLRFCKMSSKALDEIIKFTFTRSTHYYQVEDLLIDNQKNIFASAFCIGYYYPHWPLQRTDNVTSLWRRRDQSFPLRAPDIFIFELRDPRD